MHEMHLIKDLFADLTRLGKEKKAQKITKVYLRLGEFSEINDEVLKFYFKENAKSTMLEGAEIVFEKSPRRELTLVSFDWE